MTVKNKNSKISNLLSSALAFLKGLFLKLAGLFTAKKETAVYDNAAQGHLTLAELAAGVVVVGLVAGGSIQANALMEDARLTATVAQVKQFEAATTTFRDTYNAYPGDFLEAGKFIHGCTGPDGADCNPFPSTAGDNIVGNPEFGKTWASQVTDKAHVPAISANDETVLFWAHLHLADVISDINANSITSNGIKNGQPIAWGQTHPRAKLSLSKDNRVNESGFIVGTVNEKLSPFSKSQEEIPAKTLVVMLVTNAVLSGKGSILTTDAQPMTPTRAGQMDRKMDDGRPMYGFVQAYGAPTCIYDEARDTPVPPDTLLGQIMEKWDRWRNPYRYAHISTGEYNESTTSKDCGLVFRIQG